MAALRIQAKPSRSCTALLSPLPLPPDSGLAHSALATSASMLLEPPRQLPPQGCTCPLPTWTPLLVLPAHGCLGRQVRPQSAPPSATREPPNWTSHLIFFLEAAETPELWTELGTEEGDDQVELPIDQDWPEVQEPRGPTTEVSQAQGRQMPSGGCSRTQPAACPGYIS